MRKNHFASFVFAACALLGAGGVANASSVSTEDIAFTWTGTGANVDSYITGGIFTIDVATDSNSIGGLGHDVVGVSGYLHTPALGLGGFISGPVSTNVFSPAPDNYLYLTGTYVDGGGIAFQDAGGSIYAMYAIVADPMHVDDLVFGQPGIFLDWTGNLALVPTPIPGALPLLAGGLGVIGLLARRRKQKTA
jgi:hypothetical protein